MPTNVPKARIKLFGTARKVIFETRLNVYVKRLARKRVAANMLT